MENEHNIFLLNYEHYVPAIFDSTTNSLIISNKSAYEWMIPLDPKFKQIWLNNYEDLRFIVLYEVLVDFIPGHNQWKMKRAQSEDVEQYIYHSQKENEEFKDIYLKCYEMTTKEYIFVPSFILKNIKYEHT